MSQKYPYLLSPIKIGNVIFRNRLIATRSSPLFVRGSESYPTEGLITHYANKAKGGAAVVTCSATGAENFDIYEDGCQIYLSQMAEAIHFYGAKASMQIGLTRLPAQSGRGGRETNANSLEEVAEEYIRQAVIFRATGFDMLFLHMAYRFSILGKLLSPLTNRMTDRYGGSLENQARFPLLVVDRIKEKCGQDFLIEASISGSEPSGGLTLEDTIQYARMFSGHVDLLQVRAPDMDSAHPVGFTSDRMPFLYMAEAIKKSGAEIAIVTVGGYQDMDVCEDVIASGKADFIGMGRSWISNPDYGRLVYEGRKEDVVPCLRCMRCLKSSDTDPITSVCSVNPAWGLEHKIERMIELPVEKKKVAVIGGGPAGMKAALVASSRKHDVTLYEKSDALGGHFKTTDIVSFKWPQRDFKNYLSRQIAKSGVKVYLNTEATPEMLKAEKYDVILAALGSEPIVPPIPGIDQKNVIFAPDVYGKEDTLAKNVVVVGGGETGVETGMHLAEKGHAVTLIETGFKLASTAAPWHYHSQMELAWNKLPNFKYILSARCNDIKANKVTYIDSGGKERTIEAGSVVIALGMKPKDSLALQFYGAASRLHLIGDCSSIGNIQKVMRSAFGIASTL